MHSLQSEITGAEIAFLAASAMREWTDADCNYNQAQRFSLSDTALSSCVAFRVAMFLRTLTHPGAAFPVHIHRCLGLVKSQVHSCSAAHGLLHKTVQKFVTTKIKENQNRLEKMQKKTEITKPI